MDRSQICDEISKLFLESKEPHKDWKYIAERLIETKRVYLQREEALLDMVMGALKR